MNEAVAKTLLELRKTHKISQEKLAEAIDSIKSIFLKSKKERKSLR